MNFNEYPIESLMYITNRPEIVFTHGKGSWLYDNNGKRYLDFIQGWAVNSLGHCNDGMIEALNTQSQAADQSVAGLLQRADGEARRTAHPA